MNLFELVGTIAIAGAAKAQSDIDTTSEKASSAGENFKNGITTVAKWGAAIGTAAVAGATALAKFATESAATADNVDKMSQKIGISREAYQELDFICSQAGTSVDQLQTGMKTLTNQMQGAASGTASSVAMFEQLGVSVTDANGEMRSQEEVMFDVIDALQKMENQTEKAGLANDLFGKMGSELMPLLNEEAGSMEEMKNQAHELGLVLDDELIDNGVELTDSLDQTKRALQSIVTQLGGSLMPIVTKVSDYIQKAMPKIQEMINKIAPIAQNLLEGLLPPLMDLAEQVFPILVSLIETILPPLKDIVASILPIFTSLLTTFLPLVVKIVETILPPMLELIQKILPYVKEFIDSILPKISGLIQTFIDTISGIIESILPSLIEFIDTLLPIFNQIVDSVLPLFIQLIETILPVFAEIVEAVLPVFLKLVERFLPLFVQIVEAILPVIVSLLDMLSPILEAMLPILEPILELVTALLEPLFTILETLLPAITKVLQGVANTITKVVKPIIVWVVNFITKDMTKALHNIKNVFSNVFNGIHTVLKATLNAMISVLNKAIDGVNVLLTPMRAIITAVGKMFGASWTMGDVAIPHIPQLEEGGVLKKGQVGFLEGNGDEAVVPLSKNTEWIDRVAEKINSKASNSDVINKLDELIKAITSMNIVLDTGAMVGEMTPAFDTSLGNLYAAKGRGRS